MDKKKIQLILTVVLALVFVVLAGQRLLTGVGGGPPAPLEASGLQGAAQLPFLQSLVRNERLLEEQALKWDGPWKRDPFLARGSLAGSGAPVRLSGIVWDERQPVAILNDQVLKMGDEIEGYRITAIRAEAVQLTRGQETVDLPLFQSTQPKREERP